MEEDDDEEEDDDDDVVFDLVVSDVSSSVSNRQPMGSRG